MSFLLLPPVNNLSLALSHRPRTDEYCFNRIRNAYEKAEEQHVAEARRSLVSQDVFFSNAKRRGGGEERLRKEHIGISNVFHDVRYSNDREGSTRFRASRVERTARKTADVERDGDGER